MLPFLKPKPQVGVIVKQVKNGSVEEKPEQNHALEACAEDILRAIGSKDAKALASALHAAFEIADSMPHKEGPHEEDYDSMNQKAAMENE